MKKALKGIIVLSVAVLTLALVAGPAFAGCPWCYWGGSQTNVGNYASVNSSVTAVSSTGGNSVGNSNAEDMAMSGVGGVYDTDIRTGNAYSTANSAVVANTNAKMGFGPRAQTNYCNYAYVRNNVSSVSETGFNAVGNSNASDFAMSGVGGVYDTDIRTGNAYSTANSAVVVNTNAKMGSSTTQRNAQNRATVINKVSAASITGANSVGNSSASNVAASGVGCVGNTAIETGSASATANSVIVTNSNVQRGGYIGY